VNIRIFLFSLLIGFLGFFTHNFENISEYQKARLREYTRLYGAKFIADSIKNRPFLTIVTMSAVEYAPVQAVLQGSKAAHRIINNDFTLKISESASNGVTYNRYYNSFWQHLKNDNKDNVSTFILRQACYVPVDMVVSEALDKVAEVESVKMLTDNISPEKRKWLKKQLTIGVSAIVMDSAERLTKKDFASAYNKPMTSLVANHLLNEGLQDLVVEPYVVKPLGDSFAVKVGVYYGFACYVSPFIEQAVKTVFG
jgi:hypothetical protein